MKTVFHAADSRGFADHGWLKSHHTFSFAHYHDPERMGFGALRVINDDHVAGGRGFGEHPHQDMEIISIPLEGDLAHGDSMGNRGIIKHGEIQVMSAGTGIIHSEMNTNVDRPVKFLQIWVIPNQRRVTPRYQQLDISSIAAENDFQQILSPNPDDEGVWIHQNAWFHLLKLQVGKKQTYHLKQSGNGVYIFVIKGSVRVAGHELQDRDGLGVSETDQVMFEATADAEILLMEVPMSF